MVLASPVAGATWPEELRMSGAHVDFVGGGDEVRDRLRVLRPDIIHSHFTRYDRATFGVTRARTFWHVHSFRDKQSLIAQLKSRAKYTLMGRRIDAWVCVSEIVRKEILAYGAPPGRSVVIHNGIDVGRFRPATPDERTRSRERFGLEPRDRVVLFFDRTIAKGGAVLREAMEARPGFALLLNGGDAATWDQFSERHRVRHSGRITDARELYWAADILALPSFGEGFSFVLAEAAACGLPIVASAIPPVREILAQSEDAFVFPVGDAAEMARALALADRHRNVGDARHRIERNFSLERWTSDVLALYDS